MAPRKRESRSGRRPTAAGGRVTLKPCSVRGSGQFCAPLNHIIPEGSAEYWTCSCGRRWSRSSYRRHAKADPDWVDR